MSDMGQNIKEGGSSSPEESMDLEDYTDGNNIISSTSSNNATTVMNNKDLDLESEIMSNLEALVDEGSVDATSMVSSLSGTDDFSSIVSSSTISTAIKEGEEDSSMVKGELDDASTELAEQDNDDDEIQEVSFQPKAPVVVQSNIARKRTCRPPPPRINIIPKQSNQRLFGELKFMADFDPTNSSRNQQKKKKRYHPIDGRLIQYAADFDNCECLRPKCPGCHNPCQTCGDCRCGHECRQGRRWVYDSVEIEGTNLEFKNPHVIDFSS